ncbi:MAG: EamA family transporter [Sphingobium sp.]|uniref:EamA family transporter n=1 Tax=Sphingobium sp. TaxID=1912891 RepID=UPI0029AAE2A1|nr:EamA family transporter [Sphingobium sp.]MDX3909588.1 EamA family transporter [Sphingobium sp.]
MNPATFGIVLVSVLLNAMAQVVLRKAMTVSILPPPREVIALGTALVSNVWLWGGMLCYALSIGLWLVVLGRLQVSVAYPMLSIGYIIAALMGVFLLGESLGPARMLGIALICLGVIVIGRTA